MVTEFPFSRVLSLRCILFVRVGRDSGGGDGDGDCDDNDNDDDDGSTKYVAIVLLQSNRLISDLKVRVSYKNKVNLLVEVVG